MGDIKALNWKRSNLQVFWGELAPCDHIVQIYENDKVFLNSLEGFVGSGIIAGDAIIIIATAEHLTALENSLKNQGFDIDGLTASSQYLALDATETLAKFMVNNWPDETLFFELITSILSETFAPPRITTNGLTGFFNSSPRNFNSRSINKPAAHCPPRLAMTRATPSVEA